MAGVLILQVVANTTDPPIVDIPRLPLHAGTTVRVEGRLLDLTSYESGFAKGLLAQGNRSVAVLATEGVPASPGDTVLLEARVLQENGRIELEVERSDDVKVILPWRDDHIQLERLLQDPWTYRESNVRTSGLIERDQRAVWLSAGAAGRITLAGAPSHAVLEEISVVDGMFRFDPNYAAFRIEVEAIQSGE